MPNFMGQSLNSLRIEDDDYRFLIIKQQTEYQNIRNRASRITQFLFSVLSLIASFGVFQFLIGDQAIKSVIVNIPDSAVNRCSPEALTHSGVSLRGFGAINSIIAIGLFVLSIYLIVEIWGVNSKIQNLTALRPFGEADLFISNFGELQEYNSSQINESRELLDSIINRVYYSITMSAIGILMFLYLKLELLIPLIILDAILIFAGILFMGYWIQRYILHFEITSYFNNWVPAISPVFLGGTVILWGYFTWQLIQIFKLLNYFVIC